MGTIVGESAHLFDDVTGKHIGVIDLRGREQFTNGAIADNGNLTLTAENANTGRIPSGTLTYTANLSTGWGVSDGMAVWLPSSGTISFAVSGGATVNGAATTLTRTLASNAIGYVVFNRIAGSNAFSLSGV